MDIGQLIQNVFVFLGHHVYYNQAELDIDRVPFLGVSIWGGDTQMRSELNKFNWESSRKGESKFDRGQTNKL